MGAGFGSGGIPTPGWGGVCIGSSPATGIGIGAGPPGFMDVAPPGEEPTGGPEGPGNLAPGEDSPAVRGRGAGGGPLSMLTGVGPPPPPVGYGSPLFL